MGSSFFPEGVSLLCMGSCPEALASGKVVYCKVCTEGSETAKVGTDEQKLDMRQSKPDKVAHHTNVQTQKAESLLCRFSSD